MNGSTSPSGEEHPGEIQNEDLVNGRRWSMKADEVPQSMAWVNVDGVWQPVVRIEITGTAARRCITKFGIGGAFLETTIQRP